MVQRIVDETGFAHPFVSHSPLQNVDIARASISAGPFTLPPALARLRLKEWQHYCVISDDVLVTLAVVDAKFTRMAWAQVVDLRTGARLEHHRQSPLATARLSESLWDDRSLFRARGFRCDIHNNLLNHQHLIRLNIDANGALPALTAEIEIAHDPDQVESMVVSMPVGRRRCAYSHKVPLPARGWLRLGDADVQLEPARSVAILDIHKAHYPREMFWRWATFAGYDASGRLVGLNLTKNVVKDDVVWNENAAWLDGRVSRLGPAVFDFEQGSDSKPWRISTADDRVHLEFRPEGARGENLDVPGLLRSRFRQYYGRFYGTVDAGGELLDVDGLWGLCEDHESVW